MGGRDDRGETLSERTLPSMHTEATTGHRRPRTGTLRDDATRERADESHDMRRSVSGILLTGAWPVTIHLSRTWRETKQKSTKGNRRCKICVVNRRQTESRVKLAWLCRGAKEEDEVKLAWLCRGAKEEDEVKRCLKRRTQSRRLRARQMYAGHVSARSVLYSVSAIAAEDNAPDSTLS